jgi:hypothetical protein
VCLAALLGLGGAMAGLARADGDPASDVLAAQTVFLPQDGAIPAAQQSQLLELVRSATRAGYPVRVAVIARRADLGSVSALWRQPAGYARFLGQELSQVFRGTLLVVMPNGFGVYGVGASAGVSGSVSAAALRGLPSPANRAGPPGALGGAAIAAVQRLAGAAGHPLAAPRNGAPPSAGTRAGVDVVAWLALGAGAIVIAAAWTVSLRLRPPRRHDGVASSHGT